MISLGQKVELLKVISHPVRIRILEELVKGVKCVSDFEDFLEMRQPNISQHLSLLRQSGIVDYYVDGRLRCYFLVDPLIPDLLALLKKDYHETLTETRMLPCDKKGCISRGKEEVNYSG